MGREFPDGLVVRTWCSHFGGLGSVPGLETKIPQVAHCIQNDTKYCFKKSKFDNLDFLIGVYSTFALNIIIAYLLLGLWSWCFVFVPRIFFF